jgi:hypothetical protein
VFLADGRIAGDIRESLPPEHSAAHPAQLAEQPC